MTETAIAPSVVSSAHQTVTSVAAVVRSVDPAAILVPLWVLRNLTHQKRGVTGSPFSVPRRHILVIERELLLKEAADVDLTLPVDLPDCPLLILLARPEPQWLAVTPRDAVLRHYWKLLFHAHVDQEMRRKLTALGCPAVEARIERLGRSAFNEARFTLQRERDLTPDADSLEAYCEFAAVFSELKYFRPDLLKSFFPSICSDDRVMGLLGEDFDAELMLQQTKLPDAAPAVFVPIEPDAQADPAEEAAARTDLKELADADSKRVPGLLSGADKAAKAGNAVRAGILRMRVFRANRDVDAIQVAMQDLDGLVQRLRTALDLDDHTTRAWSGALIPLLAHAAGGWWNPEGRLLYDLQKVCIAQEREIYSLGIVEWLMELCRRPLRRPQPNVRQVQMIKALRSAIGRLPTTRLAPPQREAIDELLHHAIHHVELRLRDALRPKIVESLKEGGIHPHSTVAEVAQSKLVEELLDGLVHRGFINMGSLRDTISRNQLKLHDMMRGRIWKWTKRTVPRPVGLAITIVAAVALVVLIGFVIYANRLDFAKDALFGGLGAYILINTLLGGRDQLIYIDHHMGDRLDGVYHKGELYLRFFQRASIPLFATPSGRWITRTLIMPFGGAFLALAAIDHTLFLVIRWITGWHWLELSHFFEVSPHVHHHSLSNWFADNIPFVILGLLLMGVFNWPDFARIVGHMLTQLGRLLALVFFRVPQAIFRHPLTRKLIESKPFQLTTRYLFKPLAYTLVVWAFIPHHVTWPTKLGILAGVFVATNLLLNSTMGRALEQLALYWLRIMWTRVTVDVVGNLRGIFYFFKVQLERLDRLLYAVDEWLRFRTGETKASLFFKAAVGVIWFYIAYFTRFVINLLVEPQINPIKHVPVVTVSHKIIAPQTPSFITAIEALGVSKIRAGTMAVAVVTVIPGVFGFLAWELRENWKLYRANRPKNLKPIQIGSHGESMARLLRPGLHSGTVPKIFAKLRLAGLRLEDPLASDRANATIVGQLEHAEHVRESVKYFVQREFSCLLNRHPLFAATPISVGEINLTTTRIAIELHHPGAVDGAPAVIEFEQRCGWVMAAVDHAGWIEHLTPEQRELLSLALLGLYKIAAVDLVREQIMAAFAPRPVTIDVSHDDLHVWPDQQFINGWVYHLSSDEPNLPATDGSAPTLAASSVLLRHTDIVWHDWVGIWEPDNKLPLASKVSVLPQAGC